MNKYLRWALTLLWTLIIWRLTTIPDFHPSSDSVLSWILSNGGHFFFFGVLALIIPISMIPSIALTSLYGMLIEVVQLGVPGRSFSLGDWALDTLGAIIFLVITKKSLLRTCLRRQVGEFKI